ncbi:M20 family metallopeptidase [Paraburkholderia sp. BCC1884]|uniref:M20 family metallopeptidase n=1 Tax=Paraburkholderia sp. BCC1884 TaxID=2562668 RepID=UPI0011838360|nr:M20 family metallopeptidase [Paraburkholderia sp. BCC1884]
MNASGLAVELTQALVRCNTVNPPGNESDCAALLAPILKGAGFSIVSHDLSPGRTNLVAYMGTGQGQPLCFAGHMDTVPLGRTEWSKSAFGGEIVDGKLFGRGSSDMKSGIAAFVAAVLECREELAAGPGVVLLLTASEETGCQGAASLLQSQVEMHRAGAVIIGEMTANIPLVGNKGALWMRLAMRGKSAHGSMPENGINALYKAGRVLARLQQYRFQAEDHQILGRPTLSVGTLNGGVAINIVPDYAELGLDVRTVPGATHTEVKESLRSHLGDDVDGIEQVLDLPSVFSEPNNAWIASVYATVLRETGVAATPQGASYYTDGCVLQRAFPNVPIVILGPGEPAMAHQTDEYCRVDRIEAAVRIYRSLIVDWQRNRF